MKEPLTLDTMLTSKEEFMEFLQCDEELLLQRYVPLNLPGIVVGTRWLGSTEEVHKWWNTLTSQPIKLTRKNPLKLGGDDF